MDAIEMALTMAPVEIACTVANVLVPGLGSVVNALVEIGKLCMEMKENQEMCVRVEKRFREIHSQLQLMEKKGTLPKNDAVSRYADLLEKFYLFLKKQHKKNVILRLAAAKGVLVKIQDFHVEMDQLFKMLNLAHMDAMASWQQQWEKDKLQQQQQLEIVVGNTGQLLKELNTQKAQVEALTLLKFEVERSPDAEQGSDEVALLKSAFRKVVSVSKVEVQKIPPWFLPPDDVDYEAEPFSRGSFGSVHRGIWGVGTDVVVKCLIDDASSNERAKESFLKECNVWYGMNHPHVIKMFGACHVTSPPFIVCEYADNGSLDNYLSRKSTTRATVWKMLYQTCLGLEYLHSRAIVHGDLKCNNVLVVGDSAKLADFGFSFIRVRASLMSMKPQTGATRWKAPELLTGDTPSLASDVYSFAMCIIEAVTGDAPWGMVDDDTVRHLVKEGQLPPHPKEMGDNEWQLVQQMCAKGPDQRIQLKIVAGLLNKIYHAEQEREIEARLQATAINEDHEVLKCGECQFVMGRGTIFCGRCGYNVRDSKPNARGSSGSSNTVSNSSAQVIPVDFSEIKSLDAGTEDVQKVKMEHIECKNCFATAAAGTSLCPECGESMSADDQDSREDMSSDHEESDGGESSDDKEDLSSDEDEDTASNVDVDSSSDDDASDGQMDARKQTTNLRYDLSVAQIEQETESIIARMQQVDDEIAGTSVEATNWANVAQKFIDLDHEILSCVTNVTFLAQVSVDKSIRDACSMADELIEDFQLERGMRADVYKVVRHLQSTTEVRKLDAVKRRYVDKLVQDFERNGLQLDEAKQQDVQTWKQKLSTLGTQFHQNLAEETTEVCFSLDELKGLSQDYIESLTLGDDGRYTFSLCYATAFPILNTCSVPLTRKTVEEVFNCRCVDTNVPILDEMLQLRHEIALTLGYESHAAYVLQQRMAKTPAAVSNFLSELNNKLLPLAKKELRNLLSLKEIECEKNDWTFDGKINMWDFRYYMDQFVKQNCSIDQENVREFFPLDHVTNELLAMYQELLSLNFMEISRPYVWHKEVRMFAVHDARPHCAGHLVGHFYLDLLLRQGKYSHTACFTLQHSCVNSAGVRLLPAAAMIASFKAPTESKPSLLDHNDVVTYFHEFGHVMHNLCSEVDIPRFAGTRVERDFVEAPSQMLENWCWEKEPLRRLSSHYATKEKLSDELMERLISAKNANSGLLNKRQLLFATFDQLIHSAPKSDTAKMFDQLQSEIMLIDMTPGTNEAAAFGHLAGGYDAQYYGYVWSEVFSMDMFVSRFKKEGLMNLKTGLAYRELILARGGSVDATQMLKEFLGREPTHNAFLASKGLAMS